MKWNRVFAYKENVRDVVTTVVKRAKLSTLIHFLTFFRIFRIESEAYHPQDTTMHLKDRNRNTTWFYCVCLFFQETLGKVLQALPGHQDLSCSPPSLHSSCVSFGLPVPFSKIIFVFSCTSSAHMLPAKLTLWRIAGPDTEVFIIKNKVEARWGRAH